MTREQAISIMKIQRPYKGTKEKLEAYDMAIKALEQQPCEDCISRQAVLNALYALCGTGETLAENPWRDNPHIDALVDAVEDLPPVTPQPKTGEWLEKEVIDSSYKVIEEWQSARCSVCDNYHTTPYMYYFSHYDYCPYCGAQMGKEAKET